MEILRDEQDSSVVLALRRLANVIKWVGYTNIYHWPSENKLDELVWYFDCWSSSTRTTHICHVAQYNGVTTSRLLIPVCGEFNGILIHENKCQSNLVYKLGKAI